MKKKDVIDYVVPEIKTLVVTVEQGYSMSATIGGWDGDDEDHGGSAE